MAENGKKGKKSPADSKGACFWGARTAGALLADHPARRYFLTDAGFAGWVGRLDDFVGEAQQNRPTMCVVRQCDFCGCFCVFCWLMEGF